MGLKAILILALARQAFGHGYVWRITADNTMSVGPRDSCAHSNRGSTTSYPGYDVYLDTEMKPAPARIAFGVESPEAVTSVASNDLACNTPHSPPATIAQVRAGSQVTFHWSKWLYSHKGPLTAWMAPYAGDISKVNVNTLPFFKIADDTMDKNGNWGTVSMRDKTNGTYTVTIPADLAPGTYVMRQEIIGIHFAVLVPKKIQRNKKHNQEFYPHCINLNVTGTGTAKPGGVNYPGAYDARGAAFHYNNYANNTPPTPIPPLGPNVYRGAGAGRRGPGPGGGGGPAGGGARAGARY